MKRFWSVIIAIVAYTTLFGYWLGIVYLGGFSHNLILASVIAMIVTIVHFGILWMACRSPRNKSI